MKNANQIQEIKGIILEFNSSTAFNTQTRNEKADHAGWIVDMCKMGAKGFGQKIAETVSRFKKVSEKQAYCIARTIVDEEIWSSYCSMSYEKFVASNA